MSSRLQFRLWTKEELAHRATRWAGLRGWSGVTVASLLKWKQEDLIPRPTVRSLGQGRGSVSGWAWPTYRRLLRVVAYHQRYRRWRDLRIALWLDGLDVDLHRVRADLIDLYTDAVLGVNRELQTERWNAVDGAPPSLRAVKVITRRFLAPDALESWIRQLDLDPIADPVLRLVLSTLMTPKGQRAGVAFIHRLVATGAGDIPAAIADLRADLPRWIAEALDGDENEWAAHAGLLAHPAGFDNPLLDGIKVATDETLLNLREAAKQADRSWCAGMRLATALVEVRPELLGALRLMAPFASRLTSTMAARSPFQSPETRVIVMAYALASESTLADQGRRLSVGLRVLAQLAAWLADHKDLLHDIETYSEERWARLMEAPDFPSEVRRFVRAAQALQRGKASDPSTGRHPQR